MLDSNPFANLYDQNSFLLGNNSTRKYRTAYALVKVQVFIDVDDIQEAIDESEQDGSTITEVEAFEKLVDFALDEQIEGKLKMRGYDLLPNAISPSIL